MYMSCNSVSPDMDLCYFFEEDFMKLEEYLKEQLNITEEEAQRIAEVFYAYKKEYGHKHRHHHEGDNKQDIYSMISESKEECISNNYELEKIHCNGCPNNCMLSNPNCGRGQMIQEEISKLQ